MKYAMVVTLYNPKDEMVRHLFSYKDSFSRIYVFDNTTYVNGAHDLKDEFEDSVFHYYSFHDNLGISVALNMACFQAKKDGIDYILMLDQDSDFTTDDIELMKKNIESYDGEKAAMFGPTICYDENVDKKTYPRHDGYHKEEWIITSGTFLSIKAFLDIGVFDPAYFIAYIEPAYCLHAKRKGYATIVFENVVLFQVQGYFMTYHGKRHRTDPPIRDYYVHRNRLYFMNKDFHGFDKFVYRLKSLHDWIRIFLHEPYKKKRFAYLKKANDDYYHNHMGRIKE